MSISATHRRPKGFSTQANYYRRLPVAGAGEPLHSHDDLRTILVLEGVIYLIAEEDERPMTPGDEVTIAAGELHRIYNAGDSEAHVLEGVRPAHREGID